MKTQSGKEKITTFRKSAKNRSKSRFKREKRDISKTNKDFDPEERVRILFNAFMKVYRELKDLEE